MTIADLLLRQKQDLKQQGLYRRRRLIDLSENCINFSSNDYLSFANNQQVKHAYEEGFSKYPAGSGASMVVSGYHPVHHRLECEFAERLAVDSAILFSSGFTANLSVVAMLTKLNCHVLIDKAVHASIYDGIKLAGTSYTRFLHNCLNDLQEKILSCDEKQAVITEAIFSMSGQQPDLLKLATLCSLHQAACIVDEAHSFGILGPQGLGAVALHGLNQNQVPLRIITFGKAMGSQGAIVVGHEDWIDALLQAARPQLYSTAISPAMAYGLLQTLPLIMKADERRKKLFQLIDHFQQAINNSPLNWRQTNTPIQQLQLGCPHQALHYAEVLRAKGIICMPMREPTVSRCETGLRIVLNAHHEPHDIDNLFQQLHLISKSLGTYDSLY